MLVVHVYLVAAEQQQERDVAVLLKEVEKELVLYSTIDAVSKCVQGLNASEAGRLP